MLTSTAGKQGNLSDTQALSCESGSLITRKIWLPKALYDVLPVFYLVAGVMAFLATLYISEWFWVLPHYMLFSAVCLHLGFVILNRRRKARRQLDDNS